MSDDRDDRRKLSFAELDKRRRGEKVGSDEPRGRRAEEEQARVRTESLNEADSIFSMGNAAHIVESLEIVPLVGKRAVFALGTEQVLVHLRCFQAAIKLSGHVLSSLLPDDSANRTDILGQLLAQGVC